MELNRAQPMREIEEAGNADYPGGVFQVVHVLALNAQREGTRTNVNGVMAKRDSAIARLAVQLAREDAGLYMTPQEIAAKAVEFVGAAYKARAAITRGNNPDMHYTHARRLAAEFGAELINRGDIHGMVVGVRFMSGRYTSGAENIFYVS